ncbi:MAG: hypothetical protein G01um101417_614 [Parcubacteria group bacterium Gr01-1014_17]|nr:MAG: hypothetical protein G01um101417_614 [Parcubacteria group bacterium Gr01-1014_17]
MKPTTSRKTILFGLAVLAALVAFFVVSVRRGSPKSDVAFTPPVYLQDESPTALIRPLYLQGLSHGGLTALSLEHKQKIADFKKKILARIVSSEPLSSQEKTVLSISVSTTAKLALGDLVVADQSVLQFSSEELREITRALEQ